MLFKKILVSLDFSDASRLLLCCLDEFKGFGVKEVVLTHVVDISSAGGSATSFIESNKKKLEEIKSELEKNDFNVKTSIRQGAASKNIIDASTESNSSLIMLTRKGQGRIKDILIGSTAEEVAKHSKVPVLVIPC